MLLIAGGINLTDVPGWLMIAAAGILLAALEVRLGKAGFVKKTDLDGLSQRVDKDLATATKERESNARLIVMNRTDLDAARDRITRVEASTEALHDRIDEQLVKPISRIEEKMDGFITMLARHEADIQALKARKEVA